MVGTQERKENLLREFHGNDTKGVRDGFNGYEKGDSGVHSQSVFRAI